MAASSPKAPQTLPSALSARPLASPNWGNIVINGSIGSPETRIVHAYIEGNGIAPAIDVSGGTLWLEHTSFGTTTRKYLDLDGASFVISDCYFPASTGGEPLHGTQGIKEGGRGIIRNSFFGPITGYNDTIDFTGSQPTRSNSPGL